MGCWLQLDTQPLLLLLLLLCLWLPTADMQLQRNLYEPLLFGLLAMGQQGLAWMAAMAAYRCGAWPAGCGRHTSAPNSTCTFLRHKLHPFLLN
jgi:hypothetical protein